MSTLLLPPVDDVVLVKVLQALEDLQDDALHLEAENRSPVGAVPARQTPGGETHWGTLRSVPSVAALRRVRPRLLPEVAHRLSGMLFLLALFPFQFAPAQNPA